MVTRHRFVLPILFLMSVSALAVGAFVMLSGHSRPDLYDPEHEALLEARWQLSLTVPQQQEENRAEYKNAEHFRTVHNLLDRALRADPTDRQKIEWLRKKLAQLEAADRAVRKNTEKRRKVYQQIEAEMSRHIDLAD